MECGDKMIALIESGCRALVVDFKSLAYISSAGFRALLLAAKKAEETSSQFVLCGISGKIKQLFEIGGFTDLFRTYPSREEGLGAMQE
jgi:anti-anti-sigma factor